MGVLEDLAVATIYLIVIGELIALIGVIGGETIVDMMGLKQQIGAAPSPGG